MNDASKQRNRLPKPIAILRNVVILALVALVFVGVAFGLSKGSAAPMGVAVLAIGLSVVIVPFIAMFSGFSAMLSDGYPQSKISHIAIMLSVVGPVPVFLACQIAGLAIAATTGWMPYLIPILAAAAGILLAIAIWALAAFCVETFR